MGDNDFFQTEADQVSVWRAAECLLGVRFGSQPKPLKRPLSGEERKSISGGWRFASGLPDFNGLVMGVRILA